MGRNNSPMALSGDLLLPDLSQFLVEVNQQLLLLHGRTVHEILREKIATLRIHVGETGQKHRAILIVIPFGKNQVDELIHAYGLCTRSVRLRDNQLRNRRDDRVLMRIESLES